MLYPINVAIFCIVIFATTYKIAGKFRGKKAFSAVYEPLRHHDNSLEEVKLLKKEVR